MPVIKLMSLPPKSGAGAGLACVTRFVSNPDERTMAKKSTPTIAPINRALAKYFRDDEPGFCVFMLIPFCYPYARDDRCEAFWIKSKRGDGRRLMMGEAGIGLSRF